MEKTGICSKCGLQSNLKTGIKNGKEWAGYFCSDRSCKTVEWVNTRQSAPKPFRKESLPKEPDWEAIRQRKEEGMEWLNAKNNAAQIVAALVSKGEISYVDWFDAFKNITENIFGYNETKK